MREGHARRACEVDPEQCESARQRHQDSLDTASIKQELVQGQYMTAGRWSQLKPEPEIMLPDLGGSAVSSYFRAGGLVGATARYVCMPRIKNPEWIISADGVEILIGRLGRLSIERRLGRFDTYIRISGEYSVTGRDEAVARTVAKRLFAPAITKACKRAADSDEVNSVLMEAFAGMDACLSKLQRDESRRLTGRKPDFVIFDEFYEHQSINYKEELQVQESPKKRWLPGQGEW
jgi:hypothetical protein